MYAPARLPWCVEQGRNRLRDSAEERFGKVMRHFGGAKGGRADVREKATSRGEGGDGVG